MQIPDTYPTLPMRAYDGPKTLPRADPAAARRRLWLTLGIVLVALIVGGGWDGYWHVTHPFDGFFSPPHVFIYGVALVAAGVILSMLLSARARLALGPGFRVPLIPYPVPGALFILGAGITMTGVAGLVFDNFWHSNFGLDETNWSFPHAMIGWSLLLLTFGLIACRLALRERFPLRWYTTLWLGLLLLLASPTPLMGPLHTNRTPTTVGIISTLSVLAVQPPAQHAFRIYETWNLTRTNPLLVALAPFWAGAALAFVRRLDRRAWVMLVAVALWWLLDDARGQAQRFSQAHPGVLDNPANWSALPLLLPALLIALLPLARVPERWAWGVAGVVFGLLICATYGDPAGALLLTPLAAATMLLGKRAGERAYEIVERPYPAAAVVPLIAAGMLVPAFTGAIDLFLRAVTP